MKIYCFEQLKPETAREIAEIDETKFSSVANWINSMNDEEYDEFTDKYGSESLFYGEIRVFYGFYKKMLNGHYTKPDSYDPETKTIVVYINKWGDDLDVKRKLYDTLYAKKRS